jgi:SAM-dependent methyltransferase
MKPEHELAELDGLLPGQSREAWQAFYLDRAKPCPFFVASPDESLAQWVTEGVVRPGRALDLGCGHGRNAVYLASRGFTVDAVDYSESAVAWARERVEAADAAVTLACRSVFDGGFESSAYDLVYDSGCFHHIAPHRRRQYVELVADALKPDGWFGLACFRPEGGSGYSDDEVYERRSLGGGLGYSEARLREVWGEHFGIRFLRPMIEQAPGSAVFGKNFLWALLAQKPGHPQDRTEPPCLSR